MLYNKLGNTNMTVSHVSLGGAAFGNLYGQAQESDYVNVIKESVKNGINYFETGFWYGQGASERAFAKALKDVPRHRFYIASKVGRYSKDTERMFDFSPERTSYETDETLRRLGLSYIDVIQVHDITFAPDLDLVRRETLPQLQKAVRQGKARYIGICDYDISLVKELLEESEVKFSTVLIYAKSSLIDNRLLNDIKYFKDKGMAVISAAPTGMGLLTNSGPQSWHPASDEIKDVCRRAADYCKSKKMELGRLATWFAVSQPDIDTTVCGFSNVAQLHDTLSVVKTGLTGYETMVLTHLQEHFFNKLPMHWDGVERKKYIAEMNKFYD